MLHFCRLNKTKLNKNRKKNLTYFQKLFLILICHVFWPPKISTHNMYGWAFGSLLNSLKFICFNFWQQNFITQFVKFKFASSALHAIFDNSLLCFLYFESAKRICVWDPATYYCQPSPLLSSYIPEEKKEKLNNFIRDFVWCSKF